ncbi:lipopolysaccharide biosynthesis protein [Pseudoxanthomonas dokdonensis]|uniref:Lipopolysaccharide biosynthesis protein n=1 Tax=Pseudoxanthomonas dokdonensis TaxID=344882 RepID=A0A0R0CZ18_9GAMM|nr:lipopolysaccharide biosynthesis protein [Pseudoxanthomonas dokdonensis]KRG71121.1 hypothetical protein ABB29_04720 [Pseudoxanthomonas dokdonensis]
MPATIVWLLLCFIATAIGTWLSIRYALHRRLLDQPGARRSHQIATPRGGGIAIVATLLLASLFLLWSGTGPRTTFASFALGLLLVAGVGWWDDHQPLSPRLRLAVQGAAAALLAWGFHADGGSSWQALVAFSSVLVLVNVWNFMDGINGLAVSQAGLVALAFVGFAPDGWSWLALALVAACCGFLPFNFPHARIFLGDVGSGGLGFVLAALLASTAAADRLDWWLLFLPLAAFLVDAGFTLLCRILRGVKWWEPHVEHAYQRAAQANGHSRVTLGYGAFTLLGLTFTLLSRWAIMPYIPLLALALLGGGVFGWLRLRKGVRCFGKE